MGTDSSIATLPSIGPRTVVASLARLPGRRALTLSQPSTKIPAVALRKRLQLTLCLAVIGLVIAAIFGIYFGMNPRSESPGALRAAVISFVLCPGSLLFATFIDAEPWTNGFVFMWLAIAVINIGLYGVIGHLVGRFLWRSD